MLKKREHTYGGRSDVVMINDGIDYWYRGLGWFMGDDLARMRMEFHGYCPITVGQKCFEYSRFDGASPHHLMLNTDSHPIIVQCCHWEHLVAGSHSIGSRWFKSKQVFNPRFSPPSNSGSWVLFIIPMVYFPWFIIIFATNGHILVQIFSRACTSHGGYKGLVLLPCSPQIRLDLWIYSPLPRMIHRFWSMSTFSAGGSSES